MDKTRKYPNCKVIICSECEFLHRNLGDPMVFKCPQCNQKHNRNFNAARNILLKTMGYSCN